MKSYPFKQVDVFTSVPFKGNPLAVVFDADDLSDSQMQGIANWTNLSETTFVQTSNDADYLLRIFTPDRELPFAGHPSVGSAHAIRDAGKIPADKRAIVQQCGAGMIPISIEDDSIIFVQAPSAKIRAEHIGKSRLTDVFGVETVDDGLVIDVGPIWMAVRVKGIDDLYRLTVDTGMIEMLSRDMESIGINIYTTDDSGDVHVRSFAPVAGVLEDPVCGSGNAAVAAHIRETGLIETLGSMYTAYQGKALGRDGRVNVRVDSDRIQIGGQSVTVIDGEIRL